MPKSRRHYRITLGDALSAHEEALKYGGRAGIHSIGLIESAIARPYTGYHRSIARKAAALVESFATNHGFSDGNKRTTLILVHLLLAKSGYELSIADPVARNVAVEEMILAVVRHRLAFDDLVEWLEERIVPTEGG